MEPKNAQDMFNLFVKLHRACTGSSAKDAEEQLSKQGIENPEKAAIEARKEEARKALAEWEASRPTVTGA